MENLKKILTQSPLRPIVHVDDETIEMNVKCKRIYIAGAGSVRVYAELTNIVHPYNLDLRGIEGISGGTAGTVKS